MVLFPCLEISAQDYPIETEILITPPYPTNLDSYLDRIDLGVVQVTNFEATNQEVYFSFTFEETSGLISINTDGIVNEPVIIAPGISILGSDEIQDIFSEFTSDDLVISGLSQEQQNAILLNRQIPEGEYRICLKAFDVNGIPLSDPSLGCLTFDVFYGERPTIFTPYDDEVINTDFMFFMWDHNVNDFAILSRLEYVVKIIDLTAESIENVSLAMLDPGVPTILEENYGNSFFQTMMNNLDLFLEEGHRYAMRVSVIDPENELSFQFGGHSEIHEFEFKPADDGLADLLIPAPQFLSDEEIEFIEDEPISIEWAHIYESVLGELSYTARLIEVGEMDIEEIIIEEIIDGTIPSVWESDEFDQPIEIDPEEVDISTELAYAMVITVSSDNEDDEFENDGRSEVFGFNLIEPEEEEEEEIADIVLPNILAPISLTSNTPVVIQPTVTTTTTTPVAPAQPVTTTTTSYQFNLKWEHDLDAEVDSVLLSKSQYTVQIIDLNQNIGTPTVDHFTDSKIKKIHEAALTTTNQSSVLIKPTGLKTFLPGHRYVMAINVVDTSEVVEYPNEGYSDFVFFEFPALPEVASNVPLPIISKPVNNSVRPNVNTVRLIWEHTLPDLIAKQTTYYKFQIIDLTARNIKNPKASDFKNALPKVYDQTVDKVDASTVSKNVRIELDPGVNFIDDHKYAIAVRALVRDANVGNSAIVYPNDGYSNIMIWTKGDGLPLPYIISPENPTVAMSSSLNINWDHGLDDTPNFNLSDLEAATTYQLRIMDLEQLDAQGNPRKITATLENFKSTENHKIYRDVILTTEKQKSITLTGPNAMIQGHRYAIVLQAISSNSNVVYPNEGFSEIVMYTHDNTDSDGCPESDSFTALPTDMVSVAIVESTLATKVFKMGDLDFKISKVEHNGLNAALAGNPETGYNGTGKITVGFIGNGAVIKVDFEGVKVNAAGQVIDGVATAKYESTSSAAVDKLANLASDKANLDPTAVQDLAQILRGGAKLGMMMSGKAVSLPIGFEKNAGGDDAGAILGITNIEFTPTRNSLVAVFSYENPEWDYYPAFAADNVAFTNDGFADQARLSLYEDFSIPTPVGDFVINATDLDDSSKEQGTYVELNCNGLKSAQLSVSYFVNRDILLPVNEEGDVVEDTETRVEINLTGQANMKGNFMLISSFTPCEIPGLEGFSVGLEQGVFDASDLKNPENLTFPTGYQGDIFDLTWSGLFIKSFSITAPPDFAGGSKDARTKFEISNLLLDDTGISVDLSVLNLLSIEKGAFNGFAISMDRLNVLIVQSQFKSANLDGRMGAPFLPDDNFFYYEGYITKEKTAIPNKYTSAYGLVVTPEEEGYYVPALKSNLLFYEETQLNLYKNKDTSGISMIIEGALEIGNTKGNEESTAEDLEIDFPAIEFTKFSFEKLKANNSAPPVVAVNNQSNNSPLEVTPPTFALVGLPFSVGGPAAEEEDAEEEEPEEEPKIAGFKLGLKDLSMEVQNSAGQVEGEEMINLDLNIGAEFNIVKPPKGSTQKGFELAADGGVNILGSIKKSSEGIYGFNSAEIVGASLSVNSTVGPLTLEGGLEFYSNDEDFGNGIVGNVLVGTEVFELTLQARFGTMPINEIERFLYFYIFGELSLPKGIPIGNTGLALSTFYGGFYSNMSKLQPDYDPKADTAQRETDPAKIYVPDEETLFGVQAGIGFYYTAPETLYAKTGFEFSMNDNGGLNEITLNGILTMVSMNPTESEFIDGIRFDSELTVDCRENIKIGGNFTAYMNLADERLVGKYDGYRVVEGRMDIDGDKFGLRLGTREEPGNVFLDVSPVGGIDGTFYLQASAGVPNAFTYPERPQFITDLLSEISGGDFSYDKNATHRGFEASQSNAFAMIAGAKITAKAAVDFSIIYARFDAMLGFDASLLPNEGIACVGGGSLGFGDYQHYGLGQAYAGLDGEIGLDIDVFGYKGKFLLAKIKAAMLLEAGFPNPVFAKGQAAMSYSVLGGIVSGKTHFELQVGEQCETYVADPLVGIKFIEGIVPNSKEGVSVFVKPILSLQNEIGEFQFQNEHEEWVSMDVRLEEFKIMNSNFVDLNIPYKIGPDGLSYDLNVSALEPYKTYHVTAMIKAYRLENGTWVQAISGGQPFKEDFTVSFTTGPRPKTVVFENVEDCYPFLNEDYYMIENNLNNKGIIKLKSTQQELFEPFTPSNQQWHSKAQARIAYNYYGNLGATEWKDVTYVPGLNVITYDFPSNQLTTNRQYKVQIED